MPARKTTTAESARVTRPRTTRPAARHSKAETAALPTDKNATQESVARLAYSYWESRGYQGGDPVEDWFRAEQELSVA